MSVGVDVGVGVASPVQAERRAMKASAATMPRDGLITSHPLEVTTQQWQGGSPGRTVAFSSFDELSERASLSHFAVSVGFPEVRS